MGEFKMMINVYVANLAKYNEGILKGSWIELPCSNLENKLSAILGNDEEYAIHDYEAPFQIGEYTNIFKLNELAEEINHLDKHEQTAIELILKTGDKNIVEAIETVQNGKYSIYTDCQTMAEVAMEYIEQIGSVSDAARNIEYYLDVESFKRDLEINGYFSDIEEENGEELSDREMENIAEELLNDSSDKTKERYFDYAAFGRDMEIEGNFYYIGKGIYVELH
jgi:antirestriction protein